MFEDLHDRCPCSCDDGCRDCCSSCDHKKYQAYWERVHEAQKPKMPIPWDQMMEVLKNSNPTI